MAEVNWIRGEINPPESGEFYVILEAQEDLFTFKKGDIEMQTDCFDKERGVWEELGANNPFWKVLAWADVLHPNIPNDLIGRVKRYFGVEVGNGK